MAMMGCLSSLNYVMQDYLNIDSNIDLEETKGHVVNSLWRRPHGKELPLRHAGGLQPTISKKLEPQLYSHKKMNFARNLKNLRKVDLPQSGLQMTMQHS